MNSSINDLINYKFEEHKRKFAIWCGSTAGSRSKICRFSVLSGKKILEHAGIYPQGELEKIFHMNNSEFDNWHKQICNKMIDKAEDVGLKEFRYGVSAKILNCYLKAYFTHSDQILNHFHPPIDRILLKELARSNIGGFQIEWKKFLSIGWSKFNEFQYIECIKHIKKSLPFNYPLWKIEYYWKGYQ